MNNLPKGQSYLCGQANEPLLYETIGACVERIAATYPDKEALVVRTRIFVGPSRNINPESMRLQRGLLASASSLATELGYGLQIVLNGASRNLPPPKSAPLWCASTPLIVPTNWNTR